MAEPHTGKNPSHTDPGSPLPTHVGVDESAGSEFLDDQAEAVNDENRSASDQANRRRERMGTIRAS